MTFDDDFIRVHFEGGKRDFPLKKFNFTWPPPETIDFMGFVFKRTNLSEITDEDRKNMTHVCRSAEYHPV